MRSRASVVTGLRGLRAPTPDPGLRPTPGVETQGGSLARTSEGAAASSDTERCDLCGVSIPTEHRHLLALVDRRIICSCEACWAMRAGEGDYRPVGNRTVWLPELRLPDDLWASFQIPIGLAFFMHSTVTECVVAMYPSPAGATESELHFDCWARMCELNPVLGQLERDIEGLIVNRLTDPPVYAIAPIDQCYALTGAIKATWEGISGGSGVDHAVTRFFDGLRAKAGAR
ncbi:MAG TPA: DUF5947 family protein [Solirubrobacteraceae bacterium]